MLFSIQPIDTSLRLSSGKQSGAKSLIGGALALVLLLANANPLLAAKPPGEAERTLIGYASPLTVRPGDTVDFKVSSFAGGYKADLVKIINGDSLS